ncbi:LysM peptidoglycan-binding domain-containing protein, partial [Kitasatospora sp. NPDC058965]|uniref:LysM peptidoglycan-binding domain-containing protein n=1 Tax=Kitasatospora sp. NPDC058965 TaxID=3346682 RepID=UPI0036C43766
MAAPRTKARAGRARDGQSPAGTRRPVSAPPARRRSPLRLLPGAVLALALLVLLLGGVPLLLWHGTQVVAAMGGEGHRSLRDLLTTPDDGRLFLWALVAIGWVAWACFAFAVLLEVPAQLRGRVVRRLPAFGWSQRMAAGLVGAVIAVLPVAGGAFAATAGPGQLTAAAAPAQLVAAPQLAALTAAPAAVHDLALPTADPGAQQPTYTVKDARPADSLWSIAERQLGSGDRWQEIAKLNAGRVMDGSGETFDADRPIQPGWQLLMPADAKADPGAGAGTAAAPQSAPAAAGPAAGARHATTTVHQGDTLSGIAQRELGDAQAWPQLFDANKGVQAPDGERLTDPNLLAPGMVLSIPGAPAPAAPATAPQSAPVGDGPSFTVTPDAAPHPRAALPRPVAPSPAPPATIT